MCYLTKYMISLFLFSFLRRSNKVIREVWMHKPCICENKSGLAKYQFNPAIDVYIFGLNNGMLNLDPFALQRKSHKGLSNSSHYAIAKAFSRQPAMCPNIVKPHRTVGMMRNVMIQKYDCKPNNLGDLHTQTRVSFQHIVRKKNISYFTKLEAQVYCLSLRQAKEYGMSSSPNPHGSHPFESMFVMP